MSQKNKKVRIFNLLVMLFVIALAGGLFAVYTLNKSPNEEIENTEPDISIGSHLFIIEPGTSITGISYDLEEQNLIKTHYLFRLIHKLFGDGKAISTGSYQIPRNFSTWQIYQKLINGQQDLISITIPEGWSQRQIAFMLEEKGITSAQGFLTASSAEAILQEYSIPGENCEGYLFPDTYMLPANYDSEYILRLFLDNFQTRMTAIYPDWEEFTPSQIHEKVTMASIVEREYRAAHEAPIIASVFYNRLDSWYPRLESCATVTYVITDILLQDHPERLTTEDIEIDHPYNTYENSGLPPGPISNPGAVALDAAFFPEKTNYIYFVLENWSAGTHNFSSNYDDFMQDKFVYLQSYRNK